MNKNNVISKNPIRVALLLYTQGLDYDDRIRKEILTIQALYSNVKFEIFAVEAKNREEDGLTSYGVPYHIPYLKSREKYPSNTHTLAKAWDFYKTVNKRLRSFDAIWCADIETFFFTLLLHGKPMLWDLHELPTKLMGSWWRRMLFHYTERKIRVMVHANEPRLRYLQEIGMVKYPEKQYVLRNYPDFNEIDSEYDDTYHRFEQWLGNDKCVYLQGIHAVDRADEESIGAVLAIPGLKAVVVGRIGAGRMSVLEKKFGRELLLERVFFTGMQKQLKTPQYIRKCVMSLVFYKNINMNNWYCEPNRLFQNINNGNPVVVGDNPPMKELVESYGIGVCAETDGSDKERIVLAIDKVLNNMSEFKKNLSASSGSWLWGAQEDVIKRIINSFLFE